MRHLCELGHRRIAVIRGPEELFDSAPRWAGVQRTANEMGIQLDSRLVFQLPNLVDSISSFEGGVRCAKQMLAADSQFSAVLAFDDLTALGVVRGLTHAGLRIPQDCSVLGFDDVLPALVSTPTITTVRQPLKEMGLQAVDYALRALDASTRGVASRPKLHKATPELVVRMSTCAPPKQKALAGVRT